ncbi:MAG: hypothetical protein NTY77_00575 [Elusimicrobia bacterium]|nr:hypothetical protein [Elusimicrobiota bacterium]
MPPEDRPQRKHQRFLIDLPLTLWDHSHRLLDSHALAHDVTPAGFGFETRTDLGHVAWVYFELRLPDGESVSGAARLAWRQRGDWGTWAGAQIVSLSARNRRKVMRIIHGDGYDWMGLANRAVVAGVIIILVVAVRMALSRDADLWMGFPFLALAACAVAAAYFNTR